MRTYTSLAILVVLLWAIPAAAGTNVWTGKFGAVSALGKGERAVITATTTGTTPILDISQCKAGVLATDDNTVTFDIEWCNDSQGSCYRVNDTSPINSATDSGMSMDPVADFIRLDIIANAGATFSMTCK